MKYKELRAPTSVVRGCIGYYFSGSIETEPLATDSQSTTDSTLRLAKVSGRGSTKKPSALTWAIRQ